MKTLSACIVFIISTVLHAQQEPAPVYSAIGEDAKPVAGRVPGALPLRDVPGRYVRLIDRKGRQWEEVQVIKHSESEITFTHQRGAVRVSLDDMPQEVQKAYNFNPFAKHDPVAQASLAQKREAAIKEMKKTPVRLALRPFTLVDGGVRCDAWPVIQEKTNKKTFSGDYITKEAVGKVQVADVVVIDLDGTSLGQDLGIKELYPLPPASSSTLSYQRYTLDPGKAWDAQQAAAAASQALR